MPRARTLNDVMRLTSFAQQKVTTCMASHTGLGEEFWVKLYCTCNRALCTHAAIGIQDGADTIVEHWQESIQRGDLED